jgi:hypothetical protein
MKTKTALRQSKDMLPWYALFLAIAACLVWIWPNVLTYFVLGIVAFGAIGDFLNVLFIKRQAEKNPSSAEVKRK